MVFCWWICGGLLNWVVVPALTTCWGCGVPILWSKVSSLALRNAATATSLTLYKRNYLLQWRAEKQKSVSHHHPEDSHYEDQDHVNPSWSEGIEVKNHYCKILLSFIFSILQLKQEFPTPSPRLVDLKSYRSTNYFSFYEGFPKCLVPYNKIYFVQN